MSRYIATRAIRGANALVTEAELMLQKALAEKGPDTPVQLPQYCLLPADDVRHDRAQVETLGQIEPILEHARTLLHPLPSVRQALDTLLWVKPWIAAWLLCWQLRPSRPCGLSTACSRSPCLGFQLAGGTSYTWSEWGRKRGRRVFKRADR
jgi:hypothetical protein